MKAALLSARGEAEVVETPVPRIGAGDILVEMRACGLCGSDLEKLSGEYTAAPPVIGHEAVGVVAEVGEGVRGLDVGDRVFPHHHVPCNECHLCRGGSPTMCPEYRAHHLDPGGFAERFRASRWLVEGGGVLPLPDDMTFEAGAFIEPLACCIRALDRVTVRAGDHVHVVGAGPMGLLLARLLPSGQQVTASEPGAFRRGLAGGDVDAVFDPGSQDVAREVRERTGGRGADVVLLASGSPAALGDALRAVRRGGTVGVIGVLEVGAPLEDASRLVTREVSLVGSNAATEGETRRAMDLIAAGEVGVADLVTHRVPLSDFHRAVSLARGAEAMKVLVVPDGEGPT